MILYVSYLHVNDKGGHCLDFSIDPKEYLITGNFEPITAAKYLHMIVQIQRKK